MGRKSFVCKHQFNPGRDSRGTPGPRYITDILSNKGVKPNQPTYQPVSQPIPLKQRYHAPHYFEVKSDHTKSVLFVFPDTGIRRLDGRMHDLRVFRSVGVRIRQRAESSPQSPDVSVSREQWYSNRRQLPQINFCRYQRFL